MQRNADEYAEARVWVVYSVVAVLVLLPRLAGMYAIDLFDDAFITFRYSENLAAGHGLVYNLGERTLGTTTPLFALILAFPSFLGIPTIAASLFLGAASDVCTAIIVYHFLSRDFSPRLGLFSVTAFAVNPFAIRVSVGGMESSLFVLLSILAIGFIASEKYWAALFASGVSCYLRPEGVVLSIIALALLTIRGVDSYKIWRLVKTAFFFALPLAAIYAYYGSLLPQSVIAKSATHSAGITEVFTEFFFPARSGVQLLYSVIAPLGIAIASRRSQFSNLLSLWLGLYVLAYAIGRPVVYRWYGLPVYFGASVFFGLAISIAVARVSYLRTLNLRTYLWAAILLVVACFLTLIYAFGPSPVRLHIYEPLEQWCDRNVSSEHTIAAGDIGVIGYYSGAVIYDLAGLVWAERASYDDHLEVINRRKPDFIFAELSSYWETLFDPNSQLRSEYTPVQRFSRQGKIALDVTPLDLTRRWQKDYVLFARKRD